MFLCTGMSLDGKISGSQGVDTKITVDDDRNFLYDHRVICDAIMVGGNTLIQDDPGLTVKSQKREEQRQALNKTKEPMKVAIVSDVCDMKARGDFMNKGDGKKVIFTTERSSSENINELKQNAEVFVYGKQRVDLRKSLEKLYSMRVESVMVEGGGALIFSLLEEDLVDEINLKIGDLIIGGENAPTLCDGKGFISNGAKQVELIDLKQKNNHLILKYRVKKTR